MLTIYKKELKQLFTGMIGFVFIAFVLLFAGIYLTVNNLRGYYPNVEAIFSSVSFIFLLMIPVLTMRSMAEETRQKTDQMLFTAPISMGEIVMGKFFAMVTVFFVAVAVICTYPLILSQFGTINFIGAYGAILAFFLFGSMLIAVGLFISSLTESQIIAAVVCLGVLLIVYFMSGLVSLLSGSAIAAAVIMTVLVALITLLVKNMTGNAPAAYIAGCCLEGALLILLALSPELLKSGLAALLNALSAFDRLKNFAYNGLFDWTAIVYYVSGAGLFCFLAAQALEKRRWN